MCKSLIQVSINFVQNILGDNISFHNLHLSIVQKGAKEIEIDAFSPIIIIILK